MLATGNQERNCEATLANMASAALLPSDGTLDIGSWMSKDDATTQPAGLFLTGTQSRAVALRSRYSFAPTSVNFFVRY